MSQHSVQEGDTESILRRARAAEFELATHRELSSEFAASFDPRGVAAVAIASLMGHLGLQRAAFVSAMAGAPPELLAIRGARPDPALAPALAGIRARVTEASSLGPGRSAFQATRLSTIFYVQAGDDSAYVATSSKISGGPFTEEDVELITAVARYGLTAVGALRAQELRIQKAQMDAELRVAKEIQESLLPESLPSIPGFELAARSEPCLAVGGDLYDVLPHPDGRISIVVADVSGKGAPASLIMAFTHAAFRALAGPPEPARLMERISELIRLSNRSHRYATCFYAELDPSARTLTYVNAGHPPPILVGKNDRRQRLGRGGAVLGLLPETLFDQHTIDMKPGDTIAIYSDGISEALNADDREFTDIEIECLLRESHGACASDVLSHLEDRLATFCAGRPFVDDRTTVILRAHD